MTDQMDRVLFAPPEPDQDFVYCQPSMDIFLQFVRIGECNGDATHGFLFVMYDVNKVNFKHNLVTGHRSPYDT